MRTVAALCRSLTADPRHDGELLAAFAAGPAEVAFTELVRRHGPLVWGTCRRLLHDPADAEDAFQAAFLVLVRRAGQLTRCSCVGPWLHRVAVWTARNVRRKNARRLARQTALPDDDHVPAPAPDPDLKTDLDAALLALPARYRDSIVLCHLLGFTRREAAERLGCPEGTLSGWLNRGLAKLRDRLRGLDPARVLAGAAVGAPAALCTSTARAAVTTSVAAASVPPAVSVLVEGVLRMFWVKKATAAAVALGAVFALGVGIGLGTRTEWSGASAQEKGPVGDKPTADAPPRPSATAEIAELEVVLRFKEKALRALQEDIRAARERFDLVKKQPGVALKDLERQLKTDAADLEQHLRSAAAVEAELADLKARLAKLKADGKPEPTKPVASALDDLFGKPEELEAAVRQAKADAEKAVVAVKIHALQLQLLTNRNGTPAQIEAAKAEVAVAQADYERAKRGLQLSLSRLAAARAMHAPSLKALGACIEVVVVDGPAPGACRVREYGRGGVLIGSVLAEDAKALELMLSRAMKDPAGPRDLWMVVSAAHSTEAVIRTARAGKAAGFTRVRLKGTLPAGLEAVTGEAGGELDGVALDLKKFAP
ncbi:MAG: sigma-70 family RNA polymerase sigma factor [Planctomycetes bacterium]|nr:sigma-70 family RNA polymerase sigma factor [Planctomycetota bacterium]